MYQNGAHSVSHFVTVILHLMLKKVAFMVALNAVDGTIIELTNG